MFNLPIVANQIAFLSLTDNPLVSSLDSFLTVLCPTPTTCLIRNNIKVLFAVFDHVVETQIK